MPSLCPVPVLACGRHSLRKPDLAVPSRNLLTPKCEPLLCITPRSSRTHPGLAPYEHFAPRCSCFTHGLCGCLGHALANDVSAAASAASVARHSEGGNPGVRFCSACTAQACRSGSDTRPPQEILLVETSPPQTTVDKTCGTPTFNIVAGPQIAFSCGMVFLQVAPDVLGFLEPPTAKMLTTCRILASEYVETWIPSANAHTHTHANIIP